MKPQCETQKDCLREWVRVMDQFGFYNILTAIKSKYVRFKSAEWEAQVLPNFYTPVSWKFAVGEVEDKPVFLGDELYDPDGNKFTVFYYNKQFERIVFTDVRGGLLTIDSGNLSWNSPKPKTVLVELAVDDAILIKRGMWPNDTSRAACVKALETINILCPECKGYENYVVINTGPHSRQKFAPIGEYGPCPTCGGKLK